MDNCRTSDQNTNSKDYSNCTLSMTQLEAHGDVTENKDSESDNKDPGYNSDSGSHESVAVPPKNKLSLGRRISSFHERIPVRIQNFLLKYTLFVFNFLSWTGGMVTIGVGSWQLTDRERHITDAMDFLLDPPILICIIGSITFVVAFPGFFGALRENLFLLKLFSLLLSIVLAVELIGGILVVLFYSIPEAREKLRFTPETVLKRAVIRYYDDDFLKRWMDNVQKQFKCCGVSHTDDGYKDWQLNMYFNCTPTNPSIERCAVPFSCCIFYPGERMNRMCGFNKTNKKKEEVEGWIYTRGCVKGFSAWLSEHEQIILIAACTVWFMQFLGVVFARIFVKRLRKQRIRIRRRQHESNSASRTSDLGLLSNTVTDT